MATTTKNSVAIRAVDLMKMSSAALANVEIEKMYEIAAAVSKDLALIKAFDENPVAAAKHINGFEVPAGFHMHIVDAANEYHPKEDDALQQISTKTGEENWVRIEIPALGVGQIACIICLWCGSAT